MKKKPTWWNGTASDWDKHLRRLRLVRKDDNVKIYGGSLLFRLPEESEWDGMKAEEREYVLESISCWCEQVAGIKSPTPLIPTSQPSAAKPEPPYFFGIVCVDSQPFEKAADESNSPGETNAGQVVRPTANNCGSDATE